MEEDFIKDFDEIYKNWAIPAYGSKASLWAWGQVLKTAAVILRDTASEFWGKAKRRAR
jgi:hypothetical protein